MTDLKYSRELVCLKCIVRVSMLTIKRLISLLLFRSHVSLKTVIIRRLNFIHQEVTLHFVNKHVYFNIKWATSYWCMLRHGHEHGLIHAAAIQNLANLLRL